MMEQKKYNQINTKTPAIQDMILSYQIGGIAYGGCNLNCVKACS